jgi:transcriptional repressor NrdR
MVMVCPFCLHKKTSVYNSRHGSKLNVMWRRRRCDACGKQFTTYESADPASILRVTEGTKHKTFSHTKLLLSILKAADHRDDLDEAVPYLCDTAEQKLYRLNSTQNGEITTSDIITVTAETLKHFDPVAYVKYIGMYQKALDAPTLRRALRRKE